jgi:hypothetical protein
MGLRRDLAHAGHLIFNMRLRSAVMMGINASFYSFALVWEIRTAELRGWSWKWGEKPELLFLGLVRGFGAWLGTSEALSRHCT